MSFDFIFHHTRAGICHHGFHTHSGNVHSFPHFFQFVRLFNEAQVTKNGIQIPHRHSRVFFPYFFGKVQCRCQHIIPFPMFQVQINLCDVVAEHHLGKIIGERINGANVCHTTDFFRFFCCHVCPYPFGKDAVISGNEQGFLQTAADFCHQEYAVFPFHPCHIVEIAVRRKGIIFIPSFQGCFARKKYSSTAFFQSGCQFSSVIYEKPFCHVISSLNILPKNFEFFMMKFLQIPLYEKTHISLKMSFLYIRIVARNEKNASLNKREGKEGYD